MRLEVQEYDRDRDYHICVDEHGMEHRVDLYVNGTLGGIDPQHLVGKFVEVEALYQYTELATGVQLVEADNG